MNTIDCHLVSKHRPTEQAPVVPNRERDCDKPMPCHADPLRVSNEPLHQLRLVRLAADARPTNSL
jgi:hypothetical protein